MSARVTEAMIMAAGLGTRMRPLTVDRPKPLIPVANRPLIVHVLAHCADAGVEHAVVNVHYLPDMLIRHLGERAHAADGRHRVADRSGPHHLDRLLHLRLDAEVLDRPLSGRVLAPSAGPAACG